MTRGGVPGAVRSESWEPRHFTLKERPSVTLSPKKHSLLRSLTQVPAGSPVTLPT